MIGKQNAREGLRLLKDAVCEYPEAKPDGAPHVDICHDLGLESDFDGRAKNYLSYSVLGLLFREKKIHYTGNRRDRLYFLVRIS